MVLEEGKIAVALVIAIIITLKNAVFFTNMSLPHKLSPVYMFTWQLSNTCASHMHTHPTIVWSLACSCILLCAFILVGQSVFYMFSMQMITSLLWNIRCGGCACRHEIFLTFTAFWLASLVHCWFNAKKGRHVPSTSSTWHTWQWGREPSATGQHETDSTGRHWRRATSCSVRTKPNWKWKCAMKRISQTLLSWDNHTTCLGAKHQQLTNSQPLNLHIPYWGFLTRMVYLCYTSCLRYTILVGNPWYRSLTD